MAICSWRKKGLIPLSLRRLADVGVARATSGVARIGFHTQATQQRKATLEEKHLWTSQLVHARATGGNVGNLVLDRIPTTPLLERFPLHLLYIENFPIVATSQSQASDKLPCDRRSTREKFRTLCNQRVPSQVAGWQTPTNKKF